MVENSPDNVESSSFEKHNNSLGKSKVLFDVTADDKPLGRIEMILFDEVVPKTTQNFKALAKGICFITSIKNVLF